MAHTSKNIIDCVIEVLRLLECPVCFDYISPPVAQCEEGHVVCNSCLRKVSRCPLCEKNFCKKRNRVLDQIVETMLYPCSSIGCPSLNSFKNYQIHEEECVFPKENSENKPLVLQKNILNNIKEHFSLSPEISTKDTKSIKKGDKSRSTNSSLSRGDQTKPELMKLQNHSEKSSACQRTPTKFSFQPSVTRLSSDVSDEMSPEVNGDFEANDHESGNEDYLYEEYESEDENGLYGGTEDSSNTDVIDLLDSSDGGLEMDFDVPIVIDESDSEANVDNCDSHNSDYFDEGDYEANVDNCDSHNSDYFEEDDYEANVDNWDSHYSDYFDEGDYEADIADNCDSYNSDY